MYQENNFNNQPLNKKKKLKWWIPVLFFVGGMILIIFSIVLKFFASFNVDVLNPEPNQGMVILGDLVLVLGFLCALMIVPSLIIVIINYKIKSLDDKIQNEKVQSNVQIDNMINSAGSLDERLLIAYIGDSYLKIKEEKFSWNACLFSFYYVFYKKVYVPAIIGIIVLRILPDIFLVVIDILLGFKFNKWYIDYAKKQINKIKLNNQNANEFELINICKRKGGTLW